MNLVTYEKLVRYCAYQPRCHKEARNKAYELGEDKEGVEELLAELIANGHLNEELFARSYARGKFKMLKWGRVKIKAGLKAHQVTDPIIKKALTEIDEEEYMHTLSRLIDKKIETTGAQKNKLQLKHSVTTWLRSKGYENDIITDLLTLKLKAK